jgi:hypothetical protein
MSGWTAVHVHANNVKPQFERISHKVLVLQDAESLDLSVRIQESLKLGSEA